MLDGERTGSVTFGILCCSKRACSVLPTYCLILHICDSPKNKQLRGGALRGGHGGGGMAGGTSDVLNWICGAR